MFQNFALSKYKLILRAKEKLLLPPYKGSTLRGGFGNAFQRISCIARDKDCAKCLLKKKCAYSYIFETPQPSDSKPIKRLEDVPRPFVIEPPLENKREYSEGETLEFNLILIGKAIDYLPYFIFTFKELGNIGIGKGRGKYELTKIEDNSGALVYSARDELVRNTNSRITPDEIFDHLQPNPALNTLRLSFITPTRIKYNHRYISRPDFHIIVRNLLRRLSALAYFHCDEELDINFNELMQASQEVKTAEANVHWKDWTRYSARQGTRMNLGGFVGEATYKGNLEPFLPLIFLGQYTHIGKACVFGLGKYEIKKGARYG